MIVMTASSGTSVVTRKVQNILEWGLESDQATQEAILHLSSLLSDGCDVSAGENTAQTRRDLRGKIERQSLKHNEDFMEAFSVLKHNLDGVKSELLSMSSLCEQMKRDLNTTKQKTLVLINQSRSLHEEGKALAIQKDSLEKYIARFQLTDNEIHLLQGDRLESTNLSLNADFFSALTRCYEIYEDCRVILETGHQRTASEVLEQMERFQETGLKRLYTWTLSQCRSSFLPSFALLSQAMYHLETKKNQLFKLALNEYCISRRNLLTHNFLQALTGGSSPIERYAHDSTRYVGDMLAWLHQEVPGERDVLNDLLSLQRHSSNAVEVSLSSILSDALVTPLNSRVEQIVLSEANPIRLFKLVGLVRFYAVTLGSALLVDSSSPIPLIICLQNLSEFTYNRFFNVLQGSVSGYVGQLVDTKKGELSAPMPVIKLLDLLKDIISASSLSLQSQDIELTKEIVAIVLNPLVAGIKSISSLASTTERDVFLLNCFYYIHTSLSLFGTLSIEEHLANLTCDMELSLDTLTSDQTSSLIANLELQPLCATLAEKSPPVGTVRAFLLKFDAFLVSPDVFLLPQLQLLQSSRHKRIVMKRSLEVAAASYQQLYEVVDGLGAESSAAYGMNKTPQQVRDLLQLEKKLKENFQKNDYYDQEKQIS